VSGVLNQLEQIDNIAQQAIEVRISVQLLNLLYHIVRPMILSMVYHVILVTRYRAEHEV